MLDEILEYQQYSFNIDKADDQVQRLKRSTLIRLNDDKIDKTKRHIALTGLNRVLTIIARYFIYNVYDGDDHLKEKTIAALKSWLGHKAPDDSASIEARELYGWLPNYVERILLSESIEKLKGFINDSTLAEKDKAELNTIISQLSDQRPQKEKAALAVRLSDMCDQLHFISAKDCTHRSVRNAEEFLYQLSNKRSFNKSGYDDDGEANTANAITYDRILGNARRAGGLKRYYLACDRSLIKDVKKLDSGQNLKKLKDADRDIVLKMTACCMLELSQKGTVKVQETKRISITEADFINWIIIAKCDKTRQQSYRYKEEIIFEDPRKGTSSGKKQPNTKWIRLNQQWLEDSGFEILIDNSETNVVKDFLKLHPNGSVFIDNGAGVAMTELKNE